MAGRRLAGVHGLRPLGKRLATVTLDQFRAAVTQALTARFGLRLGKMTFVTDVIHVRPRWLLFAWIDGQAPKTSFPFASGGEDEERQFEEFMRRVIFTLSRRKDS